VIDIRNVGMNIGFSVTGIDDITSGFKKLNLGFSQIRDSMSNVNKIFSDTSAIIKYRKQIEAIGKTTGFKKLGLDIKQQGINVGKVFDTTNGRILNTDQVLQKLHTRLSPTELIAFNKELTSFGKKDIRPKINTEQLNEFKESIGKPMSKMSMIEQNVEANIKPISKKANIGDISQGFKDINSANKNMRFEKFLHTKEAMDAMGVSFGKTSISSKKLNKGVKKLLSNSGKMNQFQKGWTDYNTKQENAVRGINRFKMEFLGVMFLGMSMAATFKGLLRPAMETFGIYDMFNTMLTVVMIPIMEKLQPILFNLMEKVMESGDGWKLAAGAIAVTGLALGQLLFVVGQLVIGISSLQLAGGLGSIFKIAISPISKVLNLLSWFVPGGKILKGLLLIGGMLGGGLLLGGVASATTGKETDKPSLIDKLIAKKNVLFEKLNVFYDNIKTWFDGIDWQEVWTKLFDFGSSISNKISTFVNKIYTDVKTYYDGIDWQKTWDKLFEMKSTINEYISTFVGKIYDELYNIYQTTNWYMVWEKLFNVGMNVVGYIADFVGTVYNKTIEEANALNWSNVWENLFKIQIATRKIIVGFVGLLIGIFFGALVRAITALPDLASLIWKMYTGEKEFELKLKPTIDSTQLELYESLKSGFKSGYLVINAPPTAMGGLVTSPQVRLVGEAGPEAIIPLNQMQNMGGGNKTINYNPTYNVGEGVIFRDELDKRMLLNELNRMNQQHLDSVRR